MVLLRWCVLANPLAALRACFKVESFLGLRESRPRLSRGSASAGKHGKHKANKAN